MRTAVFHPGTQHSWQTALALQQLQRLEWYATSIFYQPGRFPYTLEKVLPGPLAARLHREFRRFRHDGIDPALVRTGGISEWLERIAMRSGARRLAQRIDAWGNRRFVGHLASDVASDRPFALWGYNASSLSTFQLGKAHGRTCILDRTNGDFAVYNAMMDELAASHGHWFVPTERRVPQATIDTDRQEYALADRILVGSNFARATLIEAMQEPAIAAKTQVLNYCYDEALFAQLPAPQPVDRSKPVKFLFLGLVIPRKGIHLLLEAISRIPPSAAELTIIGDLQIPRALFARYAHRFSYHPTVARADVPAIMAAHDVFVLPSYFEGAGITLYEALAAGCALIQSDRCAEAVSPETGIMLDRLDADALHSAMMTAIEDRDRLDAWRAAAQARARHFSFARYRDSIAALLKEMDLWD
ncbi:glycosyltransferase family 4 protein [Novosphingobium sp.]|uniref:glycosyltransferase family 4 protein n=1 Tax=Novosphingobium sp. TaxID=1874826 RepID=UPI00286CE46E|nr:glycosyltransferase family 4 protein [Novosphingobium sp.]